MIDKLKKKIFILIFAFLSILIIGTIIIFTYLNYRNTIMTTRIFVDRVTNMGIENREGRKEPPEEPKEKKDEESLDEINIDEVYENAENHIKKIFIICVIACFLSIILIYIFAKKVSNIIVRPVQETFERQKQFISDASHELKTPLAVIEANADVLETELGNNNKWLKYIQNEIESMNKLINELLLLAKIENIDDIKKYELYNISNETEKIVSVFESLAFEKGVKIKTEIQENVKFKGNINDLEHILSTLVDNAIKHSYENKDVVVKLNKGKGNVVIKVKNYGEPISMDEQQKIFERFYRVDKSRNRDEKRYGLGLAIAKSTVEKYGGKIRIECKSGITTFEVILPIK